MDKEAQEKIAKYLYYQSTSSLSGVSWNSLTDIEDKSGNVSSTKRYWFREADQILVLIKELGYRKLPKDKPPLLSDNPYKDKPEKGSFERQVFFRGAQAQREVCIKHYEG